MLTSCWSEQVTNLSWLWLDEGLINTKHESLSVSTLEWDHVTSFITGRVTADSHLLLFPTWTISWYERWEGLSRYTVDDGIWHHPVRNKMEMTGVRDQEVQRVHLLVLHLITLLFPPSQQPSLLRPTGPDGGRTSCPSSLLRGGSVRQLGAAPPRLLGTRTHPAPVVSGGSRPSAVVPHQPAGRKSPRPPVQPEPW